MKTVYLVSHGEYDDYYVDTICVTRKHAQELVNRGNAKEIERFEGYLRNSKRPDAYLDDWCRTTIEELKKGTNHYHGYYIERRDLLEDDDDWEPREW